MKILFIGNSHTFYNDMPYIFKQICQENNIDVDVTMLARGYKGLDYHAREPETRFNILYGNYDYIILQHLQSGFDKDVLYNSAKKIKDIANISNNNRIFLYMTWTLKSERDKQPELTDGYFEAGKKLDVPVIPVGVVWWNYFDKFPKKNLYFRDDKHASPLGSTLTAYTIFRSIFGQCAKTLNEECVQINEVIEETLKKLKKS